jgi:hypothetical protein
MPDSPCGAPVRRAAPGVTDTARATTKPLIHQFRRNSISTGDLRASDYQAFRLAGSSISVLAPLTVPTWSAKPPPDEALPRRVGQRTIAGLGWRYGVASWTIRTELMPNAPTRLQPLSAPASGAEARASFGRREGRFACGLASSLSRECASTTRWLPWRSRGSRDEKPRTTYSKPA